MDSDQANRTVTEARGFADLGMFQDAWDAIETLPPLMRLAPGAVAVRIIVCTGLAKWEMGAEITRHVRPDFPQVIREAAGRFYLARAESLCAAGDTAGAKDAVRALSIVWPEGRALALESKALAGIWLSRPPSGFLLRHPQRRSSSNMTQARITQLLILGLPAGLIIGGVVSMILYYAS